MVKKLILFKGVNLWCLSKIGNLKVISFLGKKVYNCVWWYSIRYSSIIDGKNVDLLMVRNWNFPSHGFCPKLKISKLFHFDQIGCRKSAWWCSKEKTYHFRREKCRYFNSEKMKFSKRGKPWFLSNIEKFKVISFLWKQVWGNC